MMEWVNPHSWLHIDVKKPDGSVERWKIEGGSPSVLMRLGWNRNSLPAGTRVTVVGFQAKDGSLRASSRDLRFPDGRRMDLGGSGSATTGSEEVTRPQVRHSRGLLLRALESRRLDVVADGRVAFVAGVLVHLVVVVELQRKRRRPLPRRQHLRILDRHLIVDGVLRRCA